MPFTPPELRAAADRCKQEVKYLRAEGKKKLSLDCPSAVELGAKLIAFWQHWAAWYRALATQQEKEQEEKHGTL